MARRGNRRSLMTAKNFLCAIQPHSESACFLSVSNLGESKFCTAEVANGAFKQLS